LRAEWRDGRIVVRGGESAGALTIVPVSALGLGSALVPTAGSWERAGDEARFTPRFAAVAGTEYAVVTEAGDLLATVVVPRRDQPPRTIVERIEPDVDEVPANLLRFSLTFSSSMEDGSAAGRIHLLDATGRELQGTLLEEPELWDRDRRRLSVLIEPGRIKRGLQPNLQAGPPLRDGETVTLVIDDDIRDADGLPLAQGARRTYRVGPAIRSRVDPALWDVRWPVTEGEQVVIRFDRPMDRAQTQRFIRVADDGRAIRVDTRLEDLAGNSVRRVFDRDLEDPDDAGIDDDEILLTP
jgi:hypothetical protein